jgi:lipid II:glycine glycyltransferase (peptidoglycan interpeptide bridge formation enzyme)
LGYVPKGPVGDWLPDLLPALDEAAHELDLFALKLEPDAPDQDFPNSTLASESYEPSPHEVQPRRTIILDLTTSEEDIMMRMHSKTRYNIRYSGRKEVNIRPWPKVEAFTEMMAKTAERQDFGTHVPGYYQRAYDLFHPKGQCEIFVAEYEGEPLASLMVFARGSRAWYFYGASTTKERNRMPTYGLQWEAIRWAKQRGCQSYDLWGVPDASEQELEEQFTERSDGLWGVYRFKRGFGGELQRTAGAWDRAYQPLAYLPYRLLAGRLL